MFSWIFYLCWDRVSPNSVDTVTTDTHMRYILYGICSIDLHRLVVQKNILQCTEERNTAFFRLEVNKDRISFIKTLRTIPVRMIDMTQVKGVWCVHSYELVFSHLREVWWHVDHMAQGVEGGDNIDMIRFILTYWDIELRRASWNEGGNLPF